MRFQAKTALGVLVLLLAGALSCTPALAQQGASNNPPPPPQQNQSSGPAQPEPGPPPVATPGTRVWVARSPGRGWAVWRTPNRGNLGAALGLDHMGAGALGLRGSNWNGMLATAQRVLQDPQIRQQLGISDDLAKTLEGQLTDFRKKLIQEHANLEIQMIDLQNLLSQPAPDKSAVSDQTQKVGDAQLGLEKAVVDFVVTLKQEIPPEQQQKIREFLRERRDTLGENRNPPKPGSSSYAGSQPPDGSGYYYTQNEQAQYPQQWQNSQSEPEQYPPPRRYNMGEPQGSTPMTNNQ